MSVNKNKPPIDEPAAMEPDRDVSRTTALTGARDDAPEHLVVLDDLAPAIATARSLSSGDLKLLRALQSILEKRQADAWINAMIREISADLEWSEA
jgi:hypothetical protein